MIYGLWQSLVNAESERAGFTAPPNARTTPLCEQEDDVRIRGRGIYYFRQFQETSKVIPPIQFPALQHHPDWLPHTAGVIDLIDSIDLQFPTLLELEYP